MEEERAEWEWSGGSKRREGEEVKREERRQGERRRGGAKIRRD